jgi:type I restriction enzyme S subunit
MIDGLKPYPAYQSQRITWLERLPSGWALHRLGTHVRAIEQGHSPNAALAGANEEQWYVLTLSAIRNGRFVAEKRKPIAAQNLHKLAVRPGDLLLTRANTRESVGDVCVATNPMPRTIFSDLIYRINLASSVVRPEFVVYWLISRLGRYQIGRDARGSSDSMPKLAHRHIRSWLLPVPPPEEQAAIVRFLDHADRRIRRYIAAKQKLIKLLEEQKQAIIHRAVTRGLGPTKMKASGVQWIGDIPAHWELRRAKALCHSIIDCKNRTPPTVENGPYTVVRTTCVKGGRFVEEGSYKTDAAAFTLWTSRGAPRTGDVFFTREAPAGEACLVPDRRDLCMGQRMMYFRPDPSLLDDRFLLLSIYGPVCKSYITVTTNGSTVGHLRLGQVYAMPLLWCPIDEQKRIVAFVEREAAPIDAAMAGAQQEITLLREFRTRLIADVVTGRLDVRAAVDALADEPAELEPLDLVEDEGSDDEEDEDTNGAAEDAA